MVENGIKQKKLNRVPVTLLFASTSFIADVPFPQEGLRHQLWSQKEIQRVDIMVENSIKQKN